MQHKRSRRYRPDELALLSTIATQVGGAIENARLYDQMTRKALQLDTLSQVSETVSSNRLIEDVLQLIVTMTAQMLSLIHICLGAQYSDGRSDGPSEN